MRGVITSVVVVLLAALLGSTDPVRAEASGPPVRIGSTLALTGPLAATAAVHKVAGEVAVEQINKRGGLLGRPVEWVLLDDQSKPDVTRTLYERLITVDKVDLLIGPYGTSAILSAMAVAQRYGRVLVHHSFGTPRLATYAMQFPTSGAGIDPERTMPTRLFEALESTGQSPRSIAIVTSKFPSVQFISAGARGIAASRGIKVALYLEYEFGNREFAPIAARIKDANAEFLWVGAIGLDGNLLLDALQTMGFRPRGQFHLFPAPGPLLSAPGAAFALAYTAFEAHPPMTANPTAEELSRLFNERARQVGLPYPIAENHAGISWAAWQVLEAGVTGARSLDDKAIAAWLKAAKVDTVLGRLSFEGENNYGAEHNKIRQAQNGRWLVVWPKEWAAPGAKVVYPAP